MNRSKLTPCRKVGLSRKRNTPLKTVESLLIDDVDKASSTPKTEKTTDLKPLLKTEISNDSPCRQVGLSRKRKTSTPVDDFKLKKNLSTPSNGKVIKTKNIKIKEDKNHVDTPLDCSSENKEIPVINTEITQGPKSQEDSHVSCAKKLSKLFSSPSGAKTKHKTKKLTDTESFVENKRSENNIEKDSCSNNISSKFEIISTTKDVETKEDLNKFSIKNGEKENLHDINSEEHRTSIITSSEKSLQNSTNIVNTTINKQNQSNFIKVCYSNEKENKTHQDEILKDRKTKEQKTYCELSEDDDDFEFLPKKRKPIKLLERSKTEVGKKAKKSKNELKKSLSVGDSRSRTLTESTITSHTSSLNSLNDCFVKLEKFKESTNKHNTCLTPQEQSDDDFEEITCTPKEIKIKNLDMLKKEVEEKRQILEDLKRAKMLKRMHSTEDLKMLTSRWKHGCVNALQDLLKQLNMHAFMDMETLLKKLNIPEDFIPSSQ